MKRDLVSRGTNEGRDPAYQRRQWLVNRDAKLNALLVDH